MAALYDVFAQGARPEELGARRVGTLDRWGEELGAPKMYHLIRLIRAGFEPFRACDIAGHLSNHRNR
jgi:hypothetical protein